MKRFSEQFYTKASTVKLQSAEAKALRERVVSYMEYHPMPASVLEESRPTIRTKLLTADALQAIQIPTSLLFRASALLTAFILIVVPVLAERSVPGDSLYGVKVRFNEEVRGTFAFTPYQKIEWETERLNRRVSEARLLASEGKLTDEVEAEIAAAVKEHTSNVRAEIEELRTEDADEAALASIELTTTLALQSASLQEEGNTTLALAVTDTSSDNPAQLVVNAINESLFEQRADDGSANLPAFDKIMARVEMNTTRAFELLHSTGLKPEDNLYFALNRRLEDVGRSIDESKTARNEDEKIAGENLLSVLERTQKLIVYMSDVHANASIDIETVVPVILTKEEEAAKLAMLSSEITRKSEILESVKPKLSPQAVEKVNYSIDNAAASKQVSTQGADAVPMSLMHAKESVAMLDDALKIVAAEGVDINAVATDPVTVAATTSATTTVETEVDEE